MGLEIQFVITLLHPSDPKDIGKEAITLAKSLADLSKANVQMLSDPVRMGFSRNFETESAGGDPWPQLAPYTVEERAQLMMSGESLVQGFGERHPILQRTGAYKSSWLDYSNPLHMVDYYEEMHYTSATSGLVGKNQLTVFVGSKHPYVDRLSGGAEAKITEHVTPLGLYFSSIESGAVPPRPVHIIEDRYADLIGRIAGAILTAKADTVK